MSETSVGLAGLARFSQGITGLVGFEEAVDAALEAAAELLCHHHSLVLLHDRGRSGW